MRKYTTHIISTLWLIVKVLLVSSIWCLVANGRIAVLTNTTTPYLTYSSLGAMPDGTSTTGGLVYVSVRGCGVYRIPGSSGGAVTLVAGSSGVTGYADGYGGSAKFFYPCAMIGNYNNKIAYVTDRDNFRLRAVDLVTGYASTLAGNGVKGSADGIGTAAQFCRSYGIVYHVASGGVLYISDSDCQRIRKVALSTMAVTTIASMPTYIVFGVGVTVTNDGAFLYIGGPTAILRLNTVTLTNVTIAGSSVAGYADGIGTNAKFGGIYSTVLTPDETGLVVMDTLNYRIRYVQLETNIVTTIAGRGVSGYVDGLNLKSGFLFPYSAFWHCRSQLKCGVMISDEVDLGGSELRFVQISIVTLTQSNTPTEEVSKTATLRNSLTPSVTISIAVSHSSTLTHFESTSVSASMTLSAATASSQQSFSGSRTQSVSRTKETRTKSAGTPSITQSVKHSVSITNAKTVSLSMSSSATPSTASSLSKTLTPIDSPTFDLVLSATMAATFSSTWSSSRSEPRTCSVTSSTSTTQAISGTFTAPTDVSTVTETLKETSSTSISASRPTITLTPAVITISDTISVTHTPAAISQSSSPSITTTLLATLSHTAHTNTPRTNPRASWTITESGTQWRCSAEERAQVTVSLSNQILSQSAALSNNDGVRTRNSFVDLMLLSTILPKSTNRSSTQLLPSVALTTQPIQRELLMTAPLFLLNVTLSAPPTTPLLHWTVWNVSTRGKLVLWSYNKSFDASWHWLLVVPPDDGWLGPNAPLMLDRIVELEIVLACGGEPSLTVVLRIVAPRYTSEFAEKVALAAQISQILSIVSGSSSSGSALGRALATKSVVICDINTAMDNGVMDFGFVVCPTVASVGNDDGIFASTTPAAIPARSALLSNLLVIGLVALFLCFMGASWALYEGTSFRFSLLVVMCIPSTLLPVWTAALPSLASSFTVLAAAQASDDNGHCLPPDMVLIIAGVAFSAAPALTIISVWHWKAHPASDTNENNVVEPSWVCFEVAPVPQIHRRQPSALRSLTKLLRQSTRRAWKWRHSNVEKQQVQALRCETSLRAALVLLLDFRLLWYAGAVDQATLVVVSALAVAAGQDNTNRALCISCTSTVVGVLAAQFLVIVRCRPFATIFSCIFALATVMLTCLGVFAQLMFVVMSPSTVSGLWMVQASVACTLAVVSLSSVKMVLDAAEVIAAVHRRLSIVCGHTSSSQNPYKEPAIEEEMSEVLGKYDANVALSTPRLQSIIVKEVHPPQQDLDEEEDEDEWWRLGRGLDKFFWRDDGTAKTKTKREIGRNRLRDDVHEEVGSSMLSNYFASNAEGQCERHDKTIVINY